MTGKTFKDLQKQINKPNERDTIYLDGLYKGEGRPIIINENMLTIDGQNTTTLDAQQLSSILIINGGFVELKNLKLINGNSFNGGAIHLAGNYGSIDNCTFNNNIARFGGAIICFGLDCYVTDSTFNNNKANYGGAIEWFGEEGCVFNCTFNDNKVIRSTCGRAIFWEGEKGIVENCSFNSKQDLLGKFKNLNNKFTNYDNSLQVES